MTGIEELLKFEASERLEGNSSLECKSQPSATGLNWLETPSSYKTIGLAYRYDDNSLEALQISGAGESKVLHKTKLQFHIVNIASSYDGRLVAACLSDGSLHCYNATSTAFSLRWILPNAHSHVTKNVEESVSKSRVNGAGAAGPIRSLQFSPTKYVLALVDSGVQRVSMFHADSDNPTNILQNQISHIQASAAAWSPLANGSECGFAVGTSNNGLVHVFNYNFETSVLTSIQQISYSGSDNDDMELSWTCTHVHWIDQAKSLVVGYCCVTPSDDESDDEDDNDGADHKVQLHIFDLNPVTYKLNSTEDLGDIVPFFGVPKYGRHVFFTAEITVPVRNENNLALLLVATNVGSEVELLAKEESASWQIVDLAEENKILLPTDDDDAFCFPTGLKSILVGKSDADKKASPYVLVSATDGSLSVLKLVHVDENHFDMPTANRTQSLPELALPIAVSSDMPELRDEIQLVNAADTKVSVKLSQTVAATVAPATSTSQTASSGFSFNPSTFGSATSFSPSVSQYPSFGLPLQTSTQQSILGGSSTHPVFGKTPSLLGPALAIDNKKVESAMSTTLGSSTPFGSSATFGYNSSQPLFGSVASSTSLAGFSTLAQANSEKISFGTSQNVPVQVQLTPALVEPKSIEETKISTETTKDRNTDGSDKDEIPDETISSPQAIIASKAFDNMDQEGKNEIPVSAIGQLLENLGEGFFGEELDEQISIIDPNAKGLITKTAFISWYTNLFASNDKRDKNGSLDDDEKEDREMEKLKALKQFLLLAQNQIKSDDSTEDFASLFMTLPENEQNHVHITIDDFPKLIESMDTTYCEEEHAKTIKRLSKGKGVIYLKDFLDWYIEWLFDADVESIESESDDVNVAIDSNESLQSNLNRAEESKNASDWGSIFKKKAGTWKCNVCMVDNDADKLSCAACCAHRSGAAVVNESNHSTSAVVKAADKSSISSGGFSYGGDRAVQMKSSSNSGGFTFKLDATSSTPAEGGFSFPALSTSATTSTSAVEVIEPTNTPTAAVANDKNTTTKKLNVCDLKSDVASRAFDHLDKSNRGELPMARLEDLLDGVGEVLDTESITRVMAFLDADHTGKIVKSVFVSWFINFSSKNNMVGLDDKETQDAAKKSATECFKALQKEEGDKIYVSADDLPKLLATVNANFSDAQYDKVMTSVVDKNGRIYLEPFLDWFINVFICGVTDKSSKNDEAVHEDANESLAAASRAFDLVDKESKGFLEVSSLEDLLDAVGEGFQGDELDTQVQLIDPNQTGIIQRGDFIAWYSNLVSQADCAASLDTADRAEREEEREKAKDCFLLLATIDGKQTYVLKEDFPKVFEALKTTYCEEEHTGTLKKLVKDNDKIYIHDFLNWYVDWLFGGDENSEDNDETNPFISDSKESIKTKDNLGWGSIFKKKEGVWQCSVCMVDNEKNKDCCVACQSQRPGETAMKTSDTNTNDTTNAITAAIGASGFSFGKVDTRTATTPSSSTTISQPSGFSFGGSTTSEPSGFSFGKVDTRTATTPSSSATISQPSGFSFGGSTTSEPSGFSFGKVDTRTATIPSSSTTISQPSGFSFGGSTTSERSGFSFGSSTIPDTANAAALCRNQLVGAEPDANTTAFPASSTENPTQFSFKPASIPSTSKSGGFSCENTEGESTFQKDTPVAPTAFELQSKERKAAADVSAAFPPLSVKTPTPFSFQASLNTQKSILSSSVASKSAAAPFLPESDAPVNTREDVAASDKGTPVVKKSISTAYPPMPTQSPSPFSSHQDKAGLSIKPAVATTPAKGASTAYPPLSTKSPTPFSSQNVSKINKDTKSKLNTSILATSEKPLTKASVLYPPMFTKSPTPFSSQSTSTQNNNSTTTSSVVPVITAVAATSTKVASTAYPPLSTKSPTPFSFQGISKANKDASNISSTLPSMPTAAPVSTKVASTGYPPVSTKSPTPFNSQTTTSTAAMVSEAFTPLSTKSPTPFSFQALPTMKNDSTKSESTSIAAVPSATFSSTSTKAPTLFGTSGFAQSSVASSTSFGIQTIDTKSTAAILPSYPPLAAKSPTPFSAQDGSLLKSGSTVSGNPANFNTATPPRNPPHEAEGKESLPSLFRNQVGLQSNNSNISGLAPAMKLTPSAGITSDSDSKVHGKGTYTEVSGMQPGILRKNIPIDLSDSSREYINLVNKLHRARVELMKRSPSSSDDSMRKDIERIRNAINQIMGTVADNVLNIESSRAKSANIWGRKVEVSRKVAETNVFVQRLMSLDDGNISFILAKQPLDKDSEERRRKLAQSAFSLTRLLDMARSRFYVLDHLDDKDPHMHLFQVLIDTHKRVKSLRDDSDRLEQRFSDLFISSTRSTHDTPTRRILRSSPNVGTVSNLATKYTRQSELNQETDKNKLLQKWTTVTRSFETLKVPPRKMFDVYRPVLAFGNVAAAKSSEPVQSKPDRKPPTTKFSPPLSTVPRSGWDEMSTVDQTKIKQASYTIPRDLTETTLDVAARSALSEYGATPSIVREAVSVSNRTQKTATPSRIQSSATTSTSQSPNKKSPRKQPSESSEQVTEKLTSRDADPPSLNLLQGKEFSIPTKQPVDDISKASKGGGVFGSISTLASSLAPPEMKSTFSQSNRTTTSDNDIVTEDIEGKDNHVEEVIDYVELLTKFYQQHNPSKVSEVRSHLEKYQGREDELFAKVALKYKVPNPLLERGPGTMMSSKSTPTSSPSSGMTFFGGTPQIQQTLPKEGLGFNTFTSAPTSNTTAINISPFGNISTSTPTQQQLPFASSSGNSSSGIGSTPSLFGSPSPFGQNSLTGQSTAFGCPSPFALSQTSAPQLGSPPSASSTGLFGGRSARDLLHSFYQQYNPTKVSEVDKLLVKYQGNEEQMFRNLAKKYNMDPSVFGLSNNMMGGGVMNTTSMTTSTQIGAGGGFGMPSALGGGPTFGTIGGSTTNPIAQSSSTSIFGGSGGGNLFGSAANTTPSSSTGFGFGALAQAPATPGFGSFGTPPPTGAFGSSTPFGAPRR